MVHSASAYTTGSHIVYNCIDIIDNFVPFLLVFLFLNTCVKRTKMNYNVNTSVNNMGSRSVSTLWMYQYCVLYLAWWWFNWTETCRRIFNIDYQCMLCYWLNKLLDNICGAFNWINYFTILYNTRKGMAPIKYLHANQVSTLFLSTLPSVSLIFNSFISFCLFL